jgi:hypothetical protein
MDCAGFIAGSPFSTEGFVLGGGDDDFHSPVRQFHPGNSVFLARRDKQAFAVGTEYTVIRDARYIFATNRYSGEGGVLLRLGRPFDDVGRVRVTHVSSEGAVAEVTFSCRPIVPGDILMPYQPRTIPQYLLNPRIDRWTPTTDGKPHGFIAAAQNNFGVVGTGNIVYLSLGSDRGIGPGQRFRIYKEISPPMLGPMGGMHTPPETLGEVIVLSVQQYSSVAIIVDSYREISVGDSAEAE